MALTVSLNWIMSNTAKHRESGMFPNLETLPHPREEVGERIVSPLDAFWNTSAAARER